MDRNANGPCKSRGSIIWWIRKEKPSGCGVDGSRRLGGREDGGGQEHPGSSEAELMDDLRSALKMDVVPRTIEHVLPFSFSGYDIRQPHHKCSDARAAELGAPPCRLPPQAKYTKPEELRMQRRINDRSKSRVSHQIARCAQD